MTDQPTACISPPWGWGDYRDALCEAELRIARLQEVAEECQRMLDAAPRLTVVPK